MSAFFCPLFTFTCQATAPAKKMLALSDQHYLSHKLNRLSAKTLLRIRNGLCNLLWGNPALSTTLIQAGL